MPAALSAARIWYRNTPTVRRDLSVVDVVELTNDRVVVAFGGDAGTAGAGLYTAFVDVAAGTLGTIQRATYAAAPGAFGGVTAIRALEIAATPGGKFVATANLANSAIGRDGDLSLLTQGFGADARTAGVARHVDPTQAARLNGDLFDRVVLPGGGSVVFFANGGDSVTDLSTGVRMASFSAAGAPVGTVKTVVRDVKIPIVAGFSIDADPEQPDAAPMRGGGFGLVYKESTPSGGPQVVFQKLTAAGDPSGAKLVLAGPGATAPMLETLADGKMVAVWTSGGGVGVVKAQLLSATGAKIGGAFDVSAYIVGKQAVVDLVALENGGFAVAWSEGAGFGGYSGRMFDRNGRALGNDFALTETLPAMELVGDAGIAAVGGRLIGFASGVSRLGAPSHLEAQTWSTVSAVGIARTGGATGESFVGAAKDDRLAGGGGGDRLTGNAGSDILIGGAGADTLSGGAGRDVIVGGAGADDLTGGAGPDVFVFGVAREGRDRIRDFRPGEGDQIALDDAGFASTPFPGFTLPLTAVQIENDTTPDKAGFHFHTGTRVLSFDPDGTGAQPRVALATLDGVTALKNLDFLIF